MVCAIGIISFEGKRVQFLIGPGIVQPGVPWCAKQSTIQTIAVETLVGCLLPLISYKYLREILMNEHFPQVEDREHNFWISRGQKRKPARLIQ